MSDKKSETLDQRGQSRRVFLRKNNCWRSAGGLIGVFERLSNSLIQESPTKSQNYIDSKKSQTSWLSFPIRWRPMRAVFMAGKTSEQREIDRLQGEGMMFTNATIDMPVVYNPPEGCLWPAAIPTHTGIIKQYCWSYFRPDLFGRSFKAAGYDTGYIGKFSS